MSIQIYSYGAFIRLVTDSSVLLLGKSQVKSIEAVRQDTVKISLGEGTLNEILIKLADVTQPAGLVDVAALRDAITHMLDKANEFEEEALIKYQAQIDQLNEIKQLFNLWYSSMQIDLNFQQLEVNALVAINNRLLEAKENEEKLISNVKEQTGELKAQSLQLATMDTLLADIKAVAGQIQTASVDGLNEQKAQSLQLTALDTLLTGVKAAVESSLNKQDANTGIVTNINVTAGLIKTVLADILSELKTQSNRLATIDTTLNDIRTQNTASQNKQDAQTQLLGEIKTILANQH